MNLLIFGEQYSDMELLYPNVKVMGFGQITSIGRNKKIWKKIGKE